MYVLAFDTSQQQCHVTLLGKGGALFEEKETASGKQAECLIPLIEKVLIKGQCQYPDLSAIAVIQGPGSFTGIRIGVATARAIRLCHAIPVIGVTSLEATAWHLISNPSLPIITLLDARREQFYVQCFSSSLQALGPALLLSKKELASWLPQGPYIITGNGAIALEAFLKENYPHYVFSPGAEGTNARSAAFIALGHLQENQADKYPAIPFYIRPPDAKMPQEQV